MREIKIFIERNREGSSQNFGVLTLTEEAVKDRGNGFWEGAARAEETECKQCQRWFWDVRGGFDIRLLVGWHGFDASIHEVIKLSGVRYFVQGEKGEGVFRSLMSDTPDVAISWRIAEVT